LALASLKNINNLQAFYVADLFSPCLGFLASLKNINNLQAFYVADLFSPCLGFYGGFLAPFEIACVPKVLVHSPSKPT
jgi:hypothetical protein